MSRKHNTKHLSRGQSNYPRKIAEKGGPQDYPDYKLGDNKPASAKR